MKLTKKKETKLISEIFGPEYKSGSNPVQDVYFSFKLVDDKNHVFNESIEHSFNRFNLAKSTNITTCEMCGIQAIKTRDNLFRYFSTREVKNSNGSKSWYPDYYLFDCNERIISEIIE